MEILEYLSNLNWQTMVAMFIISYYFTHDIKSDLSRLDADVKAQGKRTDQLYQMFVDLLKDRAK